MDMVAEYLKGLQASVSSLQQDSTTQTKERDAVRSSDAAKAALQRASRKMKPRPDDSTRD